MQRKIKFILLGIVGCFVLTGCSFEMTIKEINLSEFEKKVKDKETFILEVMQTGCTHCEEFSPRLKSILQDNDLTAFSLNLSNLTKEERKRFDKITYVSGTPTVVFFKDGEEETAHKISGAASNNAVKAHLKDLGYLK